VVGIGGEKPSKACLRISILQKSPKQGYAKDIAAAKAKKTRKLIKPPARDRQTSSQPMPAPSGFVLDAIPVIPTDLRPIGAA